jgi:hypothetical protein
LSDLEASHVVMPNATVSFLGTTIGSFTQLVISRQENPCLSAYYGNIANKNTQKIQTSGSIITTSNSTLNDTNRLIFRAGKSIELGPNFEIKPGSVFKAEIGVCDN